MTSPVPSVSPVPVSGHSGWPVNRTLDDQPWLTQQPIGGVSFSWGSAGCLQTLGVTPDSGAAGGRAGRIALPGDPVPPTAEHGRGLKIINAVVDNLQLTGNEREGTTLRFEKTLEWLPGAAGRYLFSADGGS